MDQPSISPAGGAALATAAAAAAAAQAELSATREPSLAEEAEQRTRKKARPDVALGARAPARPAAQGASPACGTPRPESTPAAGACSSEPVPAKVTCVPRILLRINTRACGSAQPLARRLHSRERTPTLIPTPDDAPSLSHLPYPLRAAAARLATRQIGSDWLRQQSPHVVEAITAALTAKGKGNSSVELLHRAVTVAVVPAGEVSAQRRVHERLREGSWAHKLVSGQAKHMANVMVCFDCGHVNHNRCQQCAHHAQCPCRVQGSGPLDADLGSDLLCGEGTSVDFDQMFEASDKGAYALRNKHHTCKMAAGAKCRQLPAEARCPGKPLSAAPPSAPSFYKAQSAIVSQALSLSNYKSSSEKQGAGGGEGAGAGDEPARLRAKQSKTLWEEGFGRFEIAAARGGWAVFGFGFRVPEPTSIGTDGAPLTDLEHATRSYAFFPSSMPPYVLCACDQAARTPCGPRCQLLLAEFTKRLVAGVLPQGIIDVLLPSSAAAAAAAERCAAPLKRPGAGEGLARGAPDAEAYAELAARVARLEAQAAQATSSTTSPPVVATPLAR